MKFQILLGVFFVASPVLTAPELVPKERSELREDERDNIIDFIKITPSEKPSDDPGVQKSILKVLASAVQKIAKIVKGEGKKDDEGGRHWGTTVGGDHFTDGTGAETTKVEHRPTFTTAAATDGQATEGTDAAEIGTTGGGNGQVDAKDHEISGKPDEEHQKGDTEDEGGENLDETGGGTEEKSGNDEQSHEAEQGGDDEGNRGGGLSGEDDGKGDNGVEATAGDQDSGDKDDGLSERDDANVARRAESAKDAVSWQEKGESDSEKITGTRSLFRRNDGKNPKLLMSSGFSIIIVVAKRAANIEDQEYNFGKSIEFIVKDGSRAMEAKTFRKHSGDLKDEILSAAKKEGLKIEVTVIETGLPIWVYITISIGIVALATCVTVLLVFLVKKQNRRDF